MYVLLWSIGLYMRLTVLVVPPLIPRLESMLGFSTSQVAVITSLPALLIGAGALVGGWLVGRAGVIPTIVTGLLVTGLGSTIRSVPVAFAPFLAATVVMGAGIALIQTSMPTLARGWMPERVGRGTAVYSNGLLVGELVAAGLTGPLATHVLGDAWQWAFAIWALPIPVIVVAVLVHGRGGMQTQSERSEQLVAAHLSWRHPLIWKVAILLGTAGGLYFTGNVFLSSVLAESGRASLLDTGLAALNGFQLFSSGLLIVFADRLLGRRWPLLVIVGGALLAVPAVLWAPGDWVVLAAGVFGFFTSSMLIFALTLPAWLVPPDQVARLAAGAFAVGNGIVFAAPVIAGWIKDATGSAAAGFLPVVVLGLITMALSGGIHPHAVRREEAHG